MFAWPLCIGSHCQQQEEKSLMVRKNTVLFTLHGVNYLGISGWPTKSSWEHAATHTPEHTPAHPLQHHLHHPSTNAQRSWTTSIWGIILYEIDGWGQPLTERVKTTLRCPLWISMMENRLLEKIYVCSPLPREKATLHTHQPLAAAHPSFDQSNMSLWSDHTHWLYSAASFVMITSFS